MMVILYPIHHEVGRENLRRRDKYAENIRSENIVRATCI